MAALGIFWLSLSAFEQHEGKVMQWIEKIAKLPFAAIWLITGTVWRFTECGYVAAGDFLEQDAGHAGYQISSGSFMSTVILASYGLLFTVLLTFAIIRHFLNCFMND